MTTKEIIALAKEKLGKDITEQEAQDYLDGKIALPDEALEIVSGGGLCDKNNCPRCGARLGVDTLTGRYVCIRCGYWDLD